MKDNFNQCFKLIIGDEGGLSLDPHDKGNWTGKDVGRGALKGTKYGVSAAGYPNVDIKNLSLDGARAIYRRDFWDHINGDRLPLGLDYATFDFAINSYWTKAAITLQNTINELSVGLDDLADDGRIGNETLLHIETIEPRKLINHYCDARLAFMRRLKNWPRYERGWTRRVEGVKATALSMII